MATTAVSFLRTAEPADGSIGPVAARILREAEFFTCRTSLPEPRWARRRLVRLAHAHPLEEVRALLAGACPGRPA
jgi:hypothetical protein